MDINKRESIASIPRINWTFLNTNEDNPEFQEIYSSFEIDYIDADLTAEFHPLNAPDIVDFIKKTITKVVLVEGIKGVLSQKIKLFSENSDTIAVAYGNYEVHINVTNLSTKDSQMKYFIDEISRNPLFSDIDQLKLNKAIVYLLLFKSIAHECYHIRESKVMYPRIIERDRSNLGIPESETEILKYLGKNEERRVRGFQIKFLKELYSNLQANSNLNEMEEIWLQLLPEIIRIYETSEIDLAETFKKFPRSQVFRF